MSGMASSGPLTELEAAYLAAREARDRLDVARARGLGTESGALEAVAEATSLDVRRRIAAIEITGVGHLAPSDRRAVAAMHAGIVTADAADLPVMPVSASGCADPAVLQAAVNRGGEPLQRHLEACFGMAGAAIDVPTAGSALRLSRLGVLERLGEEPDEQVRRSLFGALQPLWQTLDGDGDDASPYRALAHGTASRWRAGGSPIEANARALGVTPEAIESWIVAILAGWRAAVAEPMLAAGEPRIEPWDWWWRAGTAQRMLRNVLPLDTVLDLNRRYHAALGADLDEIGVELDLVPRPGRPEVPVAFTTFGSRPRLGDDGAWVPARPVVLASLTGGGHSNLAELVHETGHAIHVAGIRTRPAFADWPDSDALTEALAEVLALDVAEPEWQRTWIPGGAHVPEGISIRSRYADVALDAAWALFEIRQHANPSRRPNDAWTDITTTWLGIAPHPELSWWAMRVQLVEEPGYMANYAIGAVLAAALRAAIRDARGSWLGGDPGWYGWVRERLYRHGRERSARDVLDDVLGRPPTADALLAQIVRGARIR
jgi:hypothetical protein